MIPTGLLPVYGHAGDLGDCIASLATIRAMGSCGDIAIFERPGSHRESMRGARYEALKPLLEAQPYIGSVEWSNEPVATPYDFSTFRHDFVAGENLAEWQARHVGVTITMDPWLVARRSEKGIGRTIVARSMRYQNRDFPWRRLVAEHRNKILFVGLPEEHKAFQVSNGAIVEYCSTGNLLELAEIINGADLFIGNQSCPFWIAAGLGVPLIQEVYPLAQNSIVKRRNARYFNRPPFPI